MGIIETLAGSAVNQALKAMIAVSGDEKYDESVRIMKLTGVALQNLAGKLEDKNLTEAEIDEIVAGLASVATPAEMSAIKSAVQRIVEGVF